MVFFGMNHPKHFWMFKNLIKLLSEKDLEFKIFVSEKDVLSELLKESQLNYIKLGTNQTGIFWKIMQMSWFTLLMIFYNLKYKPTILIGQALPHFAFSSFFFPKLKFYILEDTEHVSLLHKFTVPFCKKIFTTEKFPPKFGKKQISLNTFFELLYINPRSFKPDVSVIRKLKISPSQNYVLIRLVSWQAYHDLKESGIDRLFLFKIIDFFKKNCLNTYISSESELPDNLKRYQLKINPIFIHSVLYHSSLYIGEGATLAAEASLLGIPTIYINSLDTNYCKELAERYDLMLNFRSTIGVFEEIPKLLFNEAKQIQQHKLDLMFREKVDPTSIFIDLLVNG